MKFKYDLHIHSCLSPCADNDMTPCNIVLMGKLSGLDVIALTDHNSALNAGAAAQASQREQGPLVLPGMELETEEGIHVILLFEDFETALAAADEVKSKLPDIQNDKYRYGEQLIMDSGDNPKGAEQRLLLLPSAIPLYEVKEFALKYRAAAFPAHIDREGSGILSIMGEIDDDMGFAALEVTPDAPAALVDKYEARGYKILRDSDSHVLGSVGIEGASFDLDELSVKAVLDFIKGER